MISRRANAKPIGHAGGLLLEDQIRRDVREGFLDRGQAHLDLD
jgi:hypothetical protein